MTKENRGGATSENRGYATDSATIPEAEMANAATYEQLLACWEAIKSKLDSTKAIKPESLGYWLKKIYQCFSRPPYECDTGVKKIFESETLRDQLKEMDIPEEFLLHTVRMGAVKGMQDRLEENPAKPVNIYPDGTMSRLIHEEIEDDRLDDGEDERKRLIKIIDRVLWSPNMDGYSWADERLKDLVMEKTKAAERERAKEAENTMVKKEEAIATIEKNMRVPNFHLSATDADLLRPDLGEKLILWKALLESGVGRALDTFMQAHGDEEITTEIFMRLREVCETDPAVKKALHSSALPLEIVNPDSGWFAVLIINKKTTLNQFFSAAYSNMNSWFEL